MSTVLRGVSDKVAGGATYVKLEGVGKAVSASDSVVLDLPNLSASFLGTFSPTNSGQQQLQPQPQQQQQQQQQLQQQQQQQLRQQHSAHQLHHPSSSQAGTPAGLGSADDSFSRESPFKNGEIDRMLDAFLDDSLNFESSFPFIPVDERDHFASA